MTVTTNDIEARLAAVLEEAFEAGTGIYNERGFKRRIGYGNRPAVIHIDLANAWTRRGHPFSCPGLEEIIPNVQRINEAARQGGSGPLYHERLPQPRCLLRHERHGSVVLEDPHGDPSGRFLLGADR